MQKQAAAPLAIAASQLDKTSAEVKANMDKAMKTAEELVSFGQGNLEALVKSGQIWAAGVQDLGKQFAASAQAQVDQTMATWKALAGVKSLKEAMELQTTLARSSVEKAVAETSKLTDASMKLAEQTFAPLTARMSLAVERFGRSRLSAPGRSARAIRGMQSAGPGPARAGGFRFPPLRAPRAGANCRCNGGRADGDAGAGDRHDRRNRRDALFPAPRISISSADTAAPGERSPPAARTEGGVRPETSGRGNERR